MISDATRHKLITFRTPIERGICAAAGLLCLFLAYACLTDPVHIAASIGYQFTSAMGRSEFMTLYGGLYLGLGLYFLAAIGYAPWRAGAMAFFAFSSTGAFLTRGVTMALFSVWTSMAVFLAFCEFLMSVVGWFGVVVSALDER